MSFILRRVAGIILFTLLCFTDLYAAGLAISLERTNLKLSIPAGSSKAGSIKVYNRDNSAVGAKVYLEDWAYTSEQDGSKKFFPAGTTPLSCAEWISFNPVQLVIPAYGVKEINYLIKVPSDAVGGHYAVMFFESSAASPSATESAQPESIYSGLGVAVRLGLLIYVEVKDKTRRLAELSNLSVNKDTKDRHYSINADFKNTGNTYITSAGSYHIMDKEGLIYARGEFNNTYTFPEDAAKLNATWKNPIPAGEYSLVITLDLGKAQEEAELGRGPIIVKESEIEIGAAGEVIKVGELK